MGDNNQNSNQSLGSNLDSNNVTSQDPNTGQKQPVSGQKQPVSGENKKFSDPFLVWVAAVFVVIGVAWYYLSEPETVSFESIQQASQQNQTDVKTPEPAAAKPQTGAQSAHKGAQAFTKTCGGCHNAFGEGIGSLTLNDQLEGKSVDDIITLVKTSNNMFVVRHKPNLEEIATFLVESYAKANPTAKPVKNNQGSKSNVNGKFFFTKICSQCHKAHGVGDGAFNLSDRGKELGTEGVLKVINNPPNDMHLPANLTGDQKRAMAEFVAGVITNNYGSPRDYNNSQTTEGGQGIYDTNFCNQCHVINGNGAQVGPDLTHIGSKRDKEWLIQYLTNPKKVYPNTIMPIVPLEQTEIIALSEYLFSLK